MPIQTNPFLLCGETPEDHAATLAAAVDSPGQLTILFASSSLDLEMLSARIRDQVHGPVLGCTTAGELGPAGVQESSVVGVSLRGDLEAVLVAFPGLRSLSAAEIQARAPEIRRQLQGCPPGWSSFGVVLIDGLSVAEERLMASLHAAVPELQLVGGSAGDGLRFQQTGVWWEGAFRDDLAVLCVISTPQPWRILKTQHIQPTDTLLVITEAEPRQRLVREIDGEVAAVAYARAVGVPVESLGPDVFSRSPLVLHIGGDTYVRSIQRAEPDGSLIFFCAIEEGLVLSLGMGAEILPDLERCLTEAREQVGEEVVVLGFDCILRRLEMLDTDVVTQVGRLLTDNNLIGFHTYGEQRNGLHVNQTFTGVALGIR